MPCVPCRSELRDFLLLPVRLTPYVPYGLALLSLRSLVQPFWKLAPPQPMRLRGLQAVIPPGAHSIITAEATSLSGFCEGVHLMPTSHGFVSARVHVLSILLRRFYSHFRILVRAVSTVHLSLSGTCVIFRAFVGQRSTYAF